MDKNLDFELLSGFTQFLCRNRGREVILMELLNILVKEFACFNAKAYLFENGSFSLKAKIDDPSLSDPDSVLYDALEAGLIGKRPPKHCCPVLVQNNCYIVILGFGDEIFGVITYGVKDLSERTDMISLLANQAVIALKESEVFEDRKVIEQVVADFSLDMQLNYTRFVQNLRQIVNFHRLSITIPDPLHPKKLLLYGNNVNDPLKTLTLPYEGSAPAWVVSTGKPIIEEDLKVSRMFPEDELLFKAGLRCVLSVPLVSKGRTIGTINVGSRIPQYYKKKHINLLSEVADRIGPTVENALIYQSVNNNLRQALFQLEDNFYATLNAFTYLLDKRDNGTKGHSLRVIRYSVVIAEQFGLKGTELEQLRLGALLHDIGKIGIPDAILFKPGKLTDEQWQIMKTHPLLGAKMLSKINFLSLAVPVVMHHHERFDGSGYPANLKGEEIPLAARIFSIADSFDAITSERPYKGVQSEVQAIAELRRCTGTQFCPVCMDAFLSIPQSKMLEIYQECKNEGAYTNPNLIGQEFQNLTIKNFNANLLGVPSEGNNTFLLTS